MQKSIIRGLLIASAGLALAVGSTSCTKDLDQQPRIDATPDRVYVNLQGYQQVLAKLYAGYATTGQQGPAGQGDIGGIDEGTSDYIRQYWSAQELSTDEAVVAWNDPGVQDWHNMNWNSANPLILGIYSRIFYEISICNEFLRESTDEKLASRLSAADAATVRKFRTEARFLRAVAYMHAMDLFGNGPFVVETDPVGFFQPPYYTRAQYFTFVEKEFTELAADANFADARTNEYGRVDKAAAWGMLARLYLNAQVYTGTARFNDAATQAKRVIDAGYSLATVSTPTSSAYGRLFLADNNLAPARNEIVWPVVFDVNSTQSFGGTTFLVNGSTGSSSAWQRTVGQTTGWQGLRTTSALFRLFPDTAADKRDRFWIPGQTLEITNLAQFNDGLGVTKFRNVNSDNSAQGGGQNFSSIDFPMIRLGEMMLIYAEAVAIRGGAGDANLALSYVNQLRRRGFGLPTGTPSTVADINAATLATPTFLLDERARELYWEGHRRTDLIRFGRFTTGAYLWPWKGGVAQGQAVGDFRRLYPIPAADLSVNQNLKQNEGY